MNDMTGRPPGLLVFGVRCSKRDSSRPRSAFCLLALSVLTLISSYRWTSAAEPGWTLFFYVSGETRRSRELAEELKATHEAIVREQARNPAINVVALCDPPGVYQVFIRGQARADLRREHKELNMGDGQTLLNELLLPGLAASRTERNALFILGHGSGWLPGPPRGGASPYVGSLAADASHGDDGLTLAELRDALSAAAKSLPHGRFDLVAFHACDMSCFEVGYQLRHVAHFMLAPDGALPKQGLSYSSLEQLTSETSPAELGRWIIEDTEKGGSHADLRCGLTLCDLSAADSVAQALDAFVDACTVAMSAKQRPLTLDDLYEWHKSLPGRPYDTDMVKLFEFVCKSYPEHPSITTSAQRVLAALNRYRVQGGGLSLMMPSEKMLKSLARLADKEALDAMAYYAGLDLTRHHRWFSLVERMRQMQCASLQPSRPEQKEK